MVHVGFERATWQRSEEVALGQQSADGRHGYALDDATWHSSGRLLEALFELGTQCCVTRWEYPRLVDQIPEVDCVRPLMAGPSDDLHAVVVESLSLNKVSIDEGH